MVVSKDSPYGSHTITYTLTVTGESYTVVRTFDIHIATPTLAWTPSYSYTHHAFVTLIGQEVSHAGTAYRVRKTDAGTAAGNHIRVREY